MDRDCAHHRSGFETIPTRYGRPIEELIHRSCEGETGAGLALETGDRTLHHGRNEAKFQSLDSFSDSFHRMIDSIIQNDA